MKTRVMILVLFVACLFSAYAFDEDYLNLITFDNMTGQTIEFIFLSPGDSEYWGAEILGSERVLEDDDSLGFIFGIRTNAIISISWQLARMEEPMSCGTMRYATRNLS